MDTWYLLVLRCYNSQLWVEEDGMPLFVDGMPIIIEKVCSGDNVNVMVPIDADYPRYVVNLQKDAMTGEGNADLKSAKVM